MFRHILLISALAAVFALSSCSDDPVGIPGAANTNYRTVSLEHYGSSISAVWGRTASDIYASGDVLTHYDGATWEPVELPSSLPSYVSGFDAMWEGPPDVLNGLVRNALYRYDGDGWTYVYIPVYAAGIWGGTDGQVVVMDYDGRVQRLEGTSWVEVDSLPPIDNNEYYLNDYSDLAGEAPDNLYAVGANGTIAHFDGSVWTTTRFGSRTFYSAWKVPSGPLYVSSESDSLFAYDGTTLTTVDTGPSFRVYDVFGDASNVYINGIDDSRHCRGIQIREGAQWRSLMCDEFSSYCAWSAPTGETFLGKGNGLWRIEGDQQTLELGTDFEGGYQFADMWGSPEDGVFVVGTRALRYYNGEWTDLRKQDLTEETAYSISGTSAHDLWAVGSRMILHFDGDGWTWVSGADQHTMLSVWASDQEVLAVGYDGTIMRRKHDTWEKMPTNTTYGLSAVWGWDGGAFAAGEDGVILRYDGKEWKIEDSPVGWHIFDLFGFGSDDVYAVGANPFEICHFNGSEWIPQDTELFAPNGDNMSIWGTSSRNLFVANRNGHVLHFDGSTWTPLPRYTTSLSCVWGAGEGDVLVGGGGILRLHR